MLDQKTIKKIEEFVYKSPRSIQEVATHLKKNWRTIDRYILEIEKEYGTISTKVFRGGTRGALKIAYWSSIEKASNGIFQERLEKEILESRGKRDFSSFDIYQHVNDKNKGARIEQTKDEEITAMKNLGILFKETKEQILIFSGNLSFINFKTKNASMIKIFEGLVKKNIKIKILCRIDLSGMANMEKLLSLNFKYGKELIEIRHREQSLRATIFDKNLIHMKEVKEPTGKINELDKKTFMFYKIRDKEWIEWLTKVFWKMFSESIGAEKRLNELRKLI